MRRRLDDGADAEDADVTRAVFDAIRPVIENLGQEIALCARYCSVTFRGKKTEMAHVFGGEAREMVIPMLEETLGVPVKTVHPGESLESGDDPGLSGDWVVALGLSLF